MHVEAAHRHRRVGFVKYATSQCGTGQGIPRFDGNLKVFEGLAPVEVDALRFDQSGGYEMILELGAKGKPLKACQTMKLKKVK